MHGLELECLLFLLEFMMDNRVMDAIDGHALVSFWLCCCGCWLVVCVCVCVLCL